MSEEPKSLDATSLLGAIAKKAGRSVAEVRSVLAGHGVDYKPSIAIPKHLCIRSLAFTGEKKGGKVSGPIKFEWKDLKPGLMAILSDRNFRGKTTLLGLMRWCLRGRRGEDIPDVMVDWFHTVNMSFTLDSQTYEVDISDAVTPSGTLWRIDGATRHSQATFASAEDFESVMSDFFMGQLGLQVMVTHIVREEKGIDQPHDWPWLAGAMMIDPSPKVLFGTNQNLRVRMMQMYLGVPWTNATNDVMAAQGRITSETREAKAEVDRDRDRRKSRIEELETDIGKLRKALEKIPVAGDLRVKLRTANREFAAAEARLRAGLQNLNLINEDLDAANEAYTHARRELQDFKDCRVAKRVFRSLDPVCCPRCDEIFDEERRQETRSDHICVVCRTEEEPEIDPAVLEAGLKDAVAAADTVVKAQKKRVDAVNKAIADARGDRKKAEADSRRIEADLVKPTDAYPLELELIQKQARLEELSIKDVTASETKGDQAILRIAENITKEAYKPLQDDLLKEVSDLIRDYAVRFGVENVETVDLQGSANLILTKGGHSTSFSRLTDGERARFKVATTLAIIKVAERRGLGRHPGLLLIDSIGANEMVGQDYASLIAGLAQLADELPHIQVFVAAINNDTIRGHVSGQQVRYAEGDTYLW
ncbi:hypothetical protein MKK64_01020 [Methylobacterium sp. E-025]|uniref:hypothetical protein n=1 Tax=Methylobacterium sp. E-025 TaxID=2836561 RepID=UPI001FBA8093|nr:hypothetical protein [Methylobacterium sp. E-025]MCJ2109806.1 hypothetical protein [Methylobacterium sp. E-025]